MGYVNIKYISFLSKQSKYVSTAQIIRCFLKQLKITSEYRQTVMFLGKSSNEN